MAGWMNESLLKFSNWKYFLTIFGFSALITFVIHYLFIFDGIYYQSFGERIASDRIANMIQQSHKWQWLGYAFIPVVVLLRISFTAICLYSGAFISNLKVQFKDLFKVALLAEFVYVLAGIAKLIILIFFKEVNTLNDLQFQPLSLQELLGNRVTDALFIYPFSLINVFEFLYWLALAWLLSGIIEKPLGRSLKMVATSYGTGLALWVLFVMFITVNLT
ncbi:MAG: hypothetical protein ACYC25_07775 [Paludibacter sp.]